MARPCKRRRICEEPACQCFGPRDPSKAAGKTVIMTVDEFETIRLIDLNGLTQEQCAEQMNVARTTAQAIYGSARAKLAECLVHARNLCIEGGDYVICDGNVPECRGRDKRRCPQSGKEKEDSMRLAVTYENGQVFQHFGHTEFFKIYRIENREIQETAVVDARGSGHSALAAFLKEQQVDVLLCGGLGGCARRALAEAGIRLFAGVTGDADQAVEAYLKDTLCYDPQAQCSHGGGHHHDGRRHDGSCGAEG